MLWVFKRTFLRGFFRAPKANVLTDDYECKRTFMVISFYLMQLIFFLHATVVFTDTTTVNTGLPNVYEIDLV